MRRQPLQTERHTDDSDLTLIARAIRRRIWVVAISAAAATLAAVALTVLAEKEYEATGALLVSASAAIDPDRAMDTSLQLLTLPVIAERTAAQLPEFDQDEISDAVEASQEGESDVIEVTATASSRALAVRITNAFMREFLAFTLAGATQQFSEGEIELVEQASPTRDPVSPKPVRNIVFGFLIGLFLGLGLALLLERLDQRLKRQDDIAEATGLPLLASVPTLDAFRSEDLGRRPLSAPETEVFRLLRANLRYFKVQQDVTSVAVCSAEPGEGKTVVSLGLALAAVTSGERVLLIEADLRDPSLSGLLGLKPDRGLSWVLSEPGTSRPDVVQTVQAGELADAIGGATLDVLPAGTIPPNPTQLVESPQLKALISAAEEAYDLVVIDTPPALIVSDAMSIIAAARSVLVVSGLGVSTRSAAEDLAAQLDRVGAPTLGLVANFADDQGQGYERYGYGRPPASDGATSSAG